MFAADVRVQLLLLLLLLLRVGAWVCTGHCPM